MRWLLVIAIVLAGGMREVRADIGGAKVDAWGTAEYVAAGAPDPGRAWSTAELGKAVDAIAQAVADHAERLPRYRGAKSGKVFARLIEVSPEDMSLAVTDRMIAHLQRYEAMNKASKWYANGLGPPPREQIELFAVLLHESVVLSGIVGPFMATFARDDPSLPARRNGLLKFREGVAEMLLGSAMVADDRRVPDADRIVVFRYLEEAAPVLLPTLPAERQAPIRSYIEKLAAATKGDLHDAAVRVQRAIESKH